MKNIANARENTTKWKKILLIGTTAGLCSLVPIGGGYLLSEYMNNGNSLGKEFIIEEPTVEKDGEIIYIEGYTNRKETNIFVSAKNFSREGYSTWRDYPSAGRTKPYVEVKGDWTGTHAKLFEPYKPIRIYSDIR